MQVTLGLVLLIWGLIFVAMMFCSAKYGAYRKMAYSNMKKIRIIAYCVPSFFLIFVTIMFYQNLVNYLSGGIWIWMVGIGFMAGVVLFDIFESRKAGLMPVK